jgi:hypothetical protein
VTQDLITAIHDTRLHRGHLKVLAALGNGTLTLWPDRSVVAASTGLALKTVSNLLRELRRFGYLAGAS